jgi:hypothetical protein
LIIGRHATMRRHVLAGMTANLLHRNASGGTGIDHNDVAATVTKLIDDRMYIDASAEHST